MLLAVVVLLGGCAGVAEVTGTATQQDLVQIRAELAAAQAALRQTKAQIEALNPQVEARAREQTAEGERQSAALARRLDSLATSLTALTSRVEELNAQLDTLSRQGRPPGRPAPAGAPMVSPATPTPVPGAGGAPPGAPGAAPGVPPAVAAPPRTAAVSPGAPPGARSTTGGLQPQDLYQAAYIDFSKGTYTLAIAGFREFLRRYPEHPLAANAQYWIGEAYLSLARGHADGGQSDRAGEELGRSVQEFRKVLANYPRADKAPTALYKEALALIELKQPALAQQRLQYLIENFPQAEETPLARERLAALKDR